MSMFRGRGSRTRKLTAYLRRREAAPASHRPAMDGRTFPRLFHEQAVVFTDTADFTLRTLRDGILHFLMVFDRFVKALRLEIERTSGAIVKVEGDSLLLCFPDVRAACRGVDAIEATLRRLNRGRPENEQLHFSYGIGFGDILDLEGDLFGLEVNLASKLGEDLAKPGEALLTPAAAAALDPQTLRRVAAYKVVTFGKRAIPIQRLRPKATRHASRQR